MRYLLVLFISIFVSSNVLAEDTTVRMLNKLEKRSMVFDSEIVRINVGDFVENYKSRRKFRSCSKKTKRLYEIYINTYILPNFAHRCLTSIDADCLEDLEMQLIDEEKSPKYIRDIVGFFKMLLNLDDGHNFIHSTIWSH